MAPMTMTTDPEARRAPGTDSEAVPSYMTLGYVQNAIRYALRVPESEARIVMSVATDVASSLRIYGDGAVPELVIRRTMESVIAQTAMDVASEWRWIPFTDPAVVALSGPILRYADSLL